MKGVVVFWREPARLPVRTGPHGALPVAVAVTVWRLPDISSPTATIWRIA